MKTILEHGRKASTIKRFICVHCGCVFEADGGEYAHHLDTDYNQEYYSSSCPECGYLSYSVYHSGSR